MSQSGNESESDSVSVVEDSRQRPCYVGFRGPKRQAPLWKFFDTVKQDGELFSVCVQDGCTYMNKGKNNSTLKNHLMKHAAKYEEYVELQKKFENSESEKKHSEQCHQKSLLSFFSSESTTNINKPYEVSSIIFKNFQRALTTLAACTSMPLSLVDGEEFRQLVNVLDPRAAASLPCRNTLKSWVIKMSNDIRQKVVLNAQNAGKFSVCCDLWSQPGLTHSYIGVTIHYYNQESSSLESAALACRELPHPHTAEVIRQEILKILGDWNLDELNVIRYVTDAGANVVAALKPFVIIEEGETSEVDDSDHDSDEVEDSDDDESENVAPRDCEFDASYISEQYFTSNSDVHRVFPRRNPCCAHMVNVICHTTLVKDQSHFKNLQEKVMPLVNKFASSGVATEKLKCLAGKKLLKVARTRWHSFYYVINRLIELKQDVTTVCSERDWPIMFAWSELEQCRDLLKPLAEMTVYLEGDQYSTASAIIPAILSIAEHFQDCFDKLSHGVCPVIKCLQEEFKRRFEFLMDPRKENFNPTFLICSMLDPEKSAELPSELFLKGKDELVKFLKLTAKSASISDPFDNVGNNDLPDNNFRSLSKRRRLMTGIDENKSKRNEVDEQIAAFVQVLEKGDFPQGINCFEFWHERRSTFSTFVSVALQMLSIPATSASVERLFSAAGLSASGRRTTIGPALLEAEAIAKFNKKLLL